ncbi:MAG TPA: hypothetical protein VGP68_24280 [Gemmataceae bacterium]|jgi:hypothetical protein|nr:hypothetical protein [Gemmataceae bacterium]
MRRIACLLSLAACFVWLGSSGFVDSESRAFAQVKEAKDKAKAVPVLKVAPADPDDFIVQQFGPQFRQMYNSELHFMRLICQPTKQQYDKIVADNEPELKATIKKLAPRLQRMQQGMMDGQPTDPRKQFVEAITKSVQKTFAPEVAARYQKELDLRAAATKRAVVLSFVAQIDKILALTPDQRAKLGKILEQKWKDPSAWRQYLQYDGQYFPAMPDIEINKILTEAQKSVWAGISKGNVNFGFDMGIMQGIEIEAEIFLDGDQPLKLEPPADKAAGKDKAPDQKAIAK